MNNELKFFRANLNQTYDFIAKHFMLFLHIFTVVCAPVIIIDRFFFAKIGIDTFQNSFFFAQPVYFFGQFWKLAHFSALVGFMVLLDLTLILIFVIALLKAVEKLRENKTIDVIEVYKDACRSLISLWAIIIIAAFWISAWALLFVVPGIIVCFLYSFGFLVFICENIKGKAALDASSKIIQSAPFRVLAGLTAGVAVVFLFDFVIYMLLELLLEIRKDCLYTIRTLTGEIVQDVWTFFLFTCYMVYYYFIYRDISKDVQLQ